MTTEPNKGIVNSNGPCAATPHGTLIEQILDSRVAKNEREWAAAAEIIRLREQVAALTARVSTVEKQAIDALDERDIVTAQRDAMVEACKKISNVLTDPWPENIDDGPRSMLDVCIGIARTALALIKWGGGER